MTLRRIWFIHFITTVLLLFLIMYNLASGIAGGKSEDSTTAIVFLILLMLYSVPVSMLFVKKIYQWENSGKKFYYLVSIVIAGISLFTLYNYFLSVNARKPISPQLTIMAILCGANVLTYFFGLISSIDRN